MSRWYIDKSDYLMHHGRKGQQWGVTNGPPYPLGTTNKGYKIKQAINNGLKKTKQFMYDRFSEYGKDHQAVRDRFIAEYKKKGYNETAAQILAEQKYQKQDKALVKAATVGMIGVTAIPLGAMFASKFIAEHGGMAAVKAAARSAIGKKIAEVITPIVSNINVSDLATSNIKITPELIAQVKKAMG